MTVRRKRSKATREELVRRATELADVQGGVCSRDQLADLGIDHRFIAAMVAAHRWCQQGYQTIAVHTGPLDELALRWRAIWEVGSSIAHLDGVSALQQGGLTGYNDGRIWVSVVHSHKVRPTSGVLIKKVRRRVANETSPSGLPRTRPEIAAVRGATWAASDRQAALILVMVVQQRLTTGARLVEASIKVRRRARRAFIHRVALDIADGAHSLGELDFAGLCRARGLPEPTRQVVRILDDRRCYLDAGWEDIDFMVEIDGSQHQWGVAGADDSFRQNDLVLQGDRLLRMTLMGLRLEPDRFMDQVERGHALFSQRAA